MSGGIVRVSISLGRVAKVLIRNIRALTGNSLYHFGITGSHGAAVAGLRVAYLLAALAAASLAALPAAAQPKEQPAAAEAPKKATIPPPEVLLLMIRTNIIAIDQAIKTNNYTVLHALVAPDLKKLTEKEIAAKLQDIRAKGIDLSPTVVVSPDLTQPPVIADNGALQLVGLFPTKPLQVRFHMAFRPVEGFWRLAGFALDVVPVNAAPAKANAEKPAEGAKATKKSGAKQ